MLITFVLATHSPPPCHPFQVGTFLPPLHPQSLPLPPLYPPLLPTHCCPPLPPRCHPNRQSNKSYNAFQARVGGLYSIAGWFILVSCSPHTSSSLPSSSSPSSDSSLSSKNLDLESPAAFEAKEEQEGPASPSALPAFSSPLELPDPPQSAASKKQNITDK